jgi:PadR family transcriptional regulator, regulatory protein PadR
MLAEALDGKPTRSTYTVSYTLCGTQGMDYMAADLIDKLRLELRRGTLTVAVLAQLRTEHYGYTLRKALSELGLDIDEGTLYPLLRRLESQGLLTSEWREEDKREKRFYRLSAEGRTILKQLLDEWRGLNGALDNIV